jgi:hypothetical protein
MPAALAALLSLGWPALCLAEPLKVFDDPGVMLFIAGVVGLPLIGLPALLLLTWYGGRRRRTPPSPGAGQS